MDFRLTDRERPGDGLSLRSRMGRITLVLVALALSVGALSACGDDDDDGGGGGGGAGGTLDSAEAKQFRELVGISDEDVDNLRGEQFRVGAILPLSGPGRQYAIQEQNGLRLAIDHMEKYVGMDVEYESKDHKSGDPQAGASGARELGIDGYGVAMNSYYGVFGATLPDVQRYKMLSFDPGGGTGNGLMGKDFFWGMRANTPDDGFAALRYFVEKEPERKRVAMVIWDAGDAYTGPIEENLKTAVEENGMTYVGKELQAIGETEYASVLSALKSKNPDIVWLVSYATDPGHFMKQFVDSGIDAQVVGSEYTPDPHEIAGRAYAEFMVATDYFDASNPSNPLAEFFVSEYEKKFGEKPNTFYQPNYYDGGLAYLEAARRVAADGGDINSGEELNAAVESEPSFVSVYGGDASTVGELVLDPETHSPSSRPVGLFRAEAEVGKVNQLASFNIGGADFKILE